MTKCLHKCSLKQLFHGDERNREKKNTESCHPKSTVCHSYILFTRNSFAVCLFRFFSSPSVSFITDSFFSPTSFGKTKRKRLRWAHNNVLFLAKNTLWKGIQMSLSLPLALALSLGVRGQVKWLTFAHNSQVNYFAVVFLTALHTISTIHQLLWWRWSLYWQLFIGWTFKIRWICIKWTFPCSSHDSASMLGFWWGRFFPVVSRAREKKNYLSIKKNFFFLVLRTVLVDFTRNNAPYGVHFTI